jgi:hypothetical protein
MYAYIIKNGYFIFSYKCRNEWNISRRPMWTNTLPLRPPRMHSIQSISNLRNRKLSSPQTNSKRRAAVPWLSVGRNQTNDEPIWKREKWKNGESFHVKNLCLRLDIELFAFNSRESVRRVHIMDSITGTKGYVNLFNEASCVCASTILLWSQTLDLMQLLRCFANS